MSLATAAFLGAVTFFIVDNMVSNNFNNKHSVSTSTLLIKKTGIDPINISYTIEGKPITFINGRSEKTIASDSASKVVTTIFGEPIFGELNGDVATDTAIMLTQNAGGSGTFFYVAAAIDKNGTYEGTNAVFLGDRIDPQTLDIQDGMIVAQYAERKANEPMSAIPSVGVSRYFEIKNGVLVEKEQTTGILSGEVTVGPICPVQRVDIPCVVPPETYTSREVIIFAKNGKTEVARKHFDLGGKYTFNLKAGEYVVNTPRQGIGGSKDLPRKISVVAGKTTVLNFSIDTGIR